MFNYVQGIKGCAESTDVIAALERLVDASKERFGCRPINVGTGHGTTVLEMVAAMEKACRHAIPKEFAPRREGDTEAVRPLHPTASRFECSYRHNYFWAYELKAENLQHRNVPIVCCPTQCKCIFPKVV